jgi:hypothetical protein
MMIHLLTQCLSLVGVCSRMNNLDQWDHEEGIRGLSKANGPESLLP